MRESLGRAIGVFRGADGVDRRFQDPLLHPLQVLRLFASIQLEQVVLVDGLLLILLRNAGWWDVAHLFHEAHVYLSAELARSIFVHFSEILAKRRSLMDAHDHLTWEVALHVQVLVDEVVLGRCVQSPKVEVLVKLLQDNLLLGELLVQGPDVRPQLLRYE